MRYVFHFKNNEVLFSSGVSPFDAFSNLREFGIGWDKLRDLQFVSVVMDVGDRVHSKVCSKIVEGTVLKVDESDYLSLLIRFDDGTLAWRSARAIDA